MATYVNDLRLKEIATGDESGTWGTSTNTNLELIGEALGFGTEGITTNADTHTSTVADGATDPVRAMYVKYTGTLDSTCTITIAPNTLNRVHIIENGTSGSQSIIIKQGSGATVTIPTGATKMVYLDGAGSGAKVTDAFASLNLQTSGIIETSSAIQTPLIEFTDGDDAITIADGGGTTFAQTATFSGDIDLAGSIDVDGTTETDALTINGSALNYKTFGTSSFMLGDTTTGTIDAADNNVGVGVDVFAALTTGDDNVAIGKSALTANTTGYDNVAVGSSSLLANTTGRRNTAVGRLSMIANTTGNFNSAFGYNAGTAITEGTANTAVGDSALKANTTASNNTAVGQAALVANTTGHSNVGIGSASLDANTTGIRNTAVGFESLSANTEVHKTQQSVKVLYL